MSLLTQEQKEQIAAKLVNFMVNNGIMRWQEGGGWQHDLTMMKEYMQVELDNKKPRTNGKFNLIRTVPKDIDYKLREQMFDGYADYDRNPDVCKWLEKQKEMEYLKQFPLNSVHPKEFGGTAVGEEKDDKNKEELVALPDGTVLSVPVGSVPVD